MVRRKLGASLEGVILRAMEEKKADEITVLDLSAVENAVCEKFVICHGNSHTQVKAIANFISKTTLEKLKEKPWHNEGNENSEWILLDYVSIVVHVFQKQARQYYDIENLWGDAQIRKITTS